MPANNNRSMSTRAPRLQVLVNGVAAPNPVVADIVSNNHYAADTFRVTLALGSSPAGPWCSVRDMAVDIQISLDAGSTWTSLLQGSVDTVEFAPLTGTVRLAGRDRTAALIEARTQETFANQTASDIASLLAARQNLAADVATTTSLVGRYWQLEHDRTTLNQFGQATTDWDLLVSLAQHEGFDVWIDAATLHFQPVMPANGVATVLRASSTQDGPANVIGLHLDRALALADDIEVTVKSWNARAQTAFVQTAASGVSANGAGNAPRRYVYLVPNLAPDAALKLAEQKLSTLIRQERIMSADLPGELQLRPRMQVQLAGTNTEFDQVYWIEEIARRLDVQSGFTERIRASSASVNQ